MMKHLILITLALLLFPLGSLAQSKSDLSVTLPNGTLVTLTYEKLSALSRTSVTASSHGKTHTYEGCNLRDVLQAAGVDEIKSLRGPLLRRVVAVEGADGYRAVFALSELDTTIGDKQVLVVDREDGKELSADDGPWRIVVASDKRPARWVRQITRFVVTDIPQFVLGSNYAIKWDLRENISFKFIIGRVGPLFWLLGLFKKATRIMKAFSAITLFSLLGI